MWKFLKHYFMPIYTSPLDQFLQKFDETHPASDTQQREIDKYRQLHHQRDQENAQINA